jgi:hypothetical protein
VAFTPGRQHRLANAKATLNCADGFASVPVSGLNKRTNGVSVSKVHSCSRWLSAAIISIVDVPYKDFVWNIAVEEDETYIASNVIVHNCRSILVAVPLSQQVNASDILTDAEEGEALGMIPVGFSAQEKESRPAKIFRSEPEKEKEPIIKVDVHMPEQQPPIVHVHIDKSATVKEVTERDKDGLIKTWVERPLENESK